MGSNAHYKLEVFSSDNLTPNEIQDFWGFKMGDAVNEIPTLVVTIMSVDSNLTQHLVVGRRFRVTTIANSTVVFEGVVRKVEADKKGKTDNNPDIIWNLSAHGALGEFANAMAATDSGLNLTYDGWSIDDIMADLIQRSNGRSGTSLDYDSVDSTNDTVSVSFRNDNIWNILKDIAMIGDGNFSYILRGFWNNYPTIQVLDPDDSEYFTVSDPFSITNAGTGTITYTQGSNIVTGTGTSFTTQIVRGDRIKPNATTKWYTVEEIISNTQLVLVNTYEAVGGSAAFIYQSGARIVAEHDDTISVSVYDDTDRIMNYVGVTYSGHGSGSSKAETGFTGDAGTGTTFKKREAVLVTPYIRDSTTAVRLRDTSYQMFRGNSSGLRRVHCQMLSGALYSAFISADLGDMVGVELSDGTQITGRFMSWSYDDSMDALVVVIGIPATGFYAGYERLARRVSHQINALSATANISTTLVEPVPILAAGLTSTTISDNSSNSFYWGLTTPQKTSVTTAEAYMVEVEVYTDGTANTVYDGPFDVQVYTATTVSDPLILWKKLFHHSFTVLKGGTTVVYRPETSVTNSTTGSPNVHRSSYPFSGSNSNVEQALYVLVNNRSGRSITLSASGIVVRLWPVPRHTHNL